MVGRLHRRSRGCLGTALAVGLAVAAAPDLGAQQASARAYVTPAAVPRGGTFDLNVEVTGAQRLDTEPAVPDLEFATFLSSGRTSQVSIVNGVTNVSIILVYRYRADGEGTFEVAPIQVQAGGRTVATEPVTVTVGTGGPSAGGGQRQPPRASAPPPPDPAVDSEDLFVTTDVSDTRVYVGEPVIVEYRIWTRINVSQYTITRLPANTGFWVEEFPLPSPEVEQVMRDGVPFATAVIRKVALFPTGPGDRTVDPLGLDAQVRMRRRQGDIFEDFFGRSLLGQLETVSVASEPVAIEVQPLPPGAPRDFSGFVGDLDVTATVDRLAVETNQAFSYVVRISAEGNVRAIPEPEVAFPPDFEVYPPDVTEQIDRDGDRVRGARTFQYVLIPRSPGELTIPGVRVAYFDPSTASYAGSATEPIVVSVTGDPVAGPLGDRVRGSIEPVREDIRFISIAVPRFHRTNGSVLGGPAFWLVLLLPMAVLAGAVAMRRHQDRLAGDVAYARGRRASRLARRRLGRARSLVHADGREFHAEVGRALQGFLGDRLNLPEAGLMTSDVRHRLESRGVSPESVDRYLACLEECDRQRFAPSETSTAEREALLGRVEEAMARVDREARR